MQPSFRELLDNPSPVRPDNANAMALVADLQSNILSPNGKRRACYFLVKFDPGKLASVRFLVNVLVQDEDGVSAMAGALSSEALSPALERVAEAWPGGADDMRAFCASRPARVLSEYESYWQPKLHAELPDSPGSDMTVNVLLSTWGYAALKSNPPADEAFRAGMRGRAARLSDPEPKAWDPGYRDAANQAVRFDALIIVGFDPDDKRKSARLPPPALRLDALRKRIAACCSRVQEEEGSSLTAGGHSIEPFGFRDGISQPIFYERELNRRGVATSSFKPYARLRLVLSPDPHGTTEYACGSYIVFRKLRQDIDAFYRQASLLAQQSGLAPEELIERFVGRKRDGRALVGTNPRDWNDFDYSDDQQGNRCPFYAHVRKHNPRSDLNSSYDPNKRRIVRRGLPYGPPIHRDPDGKPKDGRVQLVDPNDHPEHGLLFLCAQGNIAGQFEHLQTAWANDSKHPRGKQSATDAVSGQSAKHAIQVRGGARHAVTPPLAYTSAVSLRGGEYFFAPSLSGLRKLFQETEHL